MRSNTPGFVPHSFDCDGAFEAVLARVELLSGENVLGVVAREKGTGYAGFLEAVFSVEVTCGCGGAAAFGDALPGD